MALVVVVVAAAGLIAVALRRRWSGMRLRAPWLVLLAAAAEAAGAVAGGRWSAVGLVAAALLAVAFLSANRALRGVGLVALGLAANALVIGANGAMPVSLAAAQRAGADVGPVLLGLDERHELATGATRLRALADVVPLPLPVAPEVVSAGDVLVAAGLAQLVLSLTRPRDSRRAAVPRGGVAPARTGRS